jgi:glycerophosphoryl diester phosphodiesterase
MRTLFLLLALLTTACTHQRGVVIAHRGASWYLPEHTLEAYALAHAQGADMIEPDVVLTRDSVPICAHDLTMDAVTDVASVYPARVRPDGHWYWADFDLAELRALRRTGRNEPPVDGYTVCTLEEMLTLITRLNERTGRIVGIAPELKGPDHHAAAGLDLPGTVLRTLDAHGYTGPDDPIILQCFSLEAIEAVHASGCRLPLVWATGETPTDEQFERARAVCHGIVPNRKLVEDESGRPTDFARRCRDAGLALYPYTFKSEPEAVRRFLQRHRVAGVFSDDPAVLSR